MLAPVLQNSVNSRTNEHQNNLSFSMKLFGNAFSNPVIFPHMGAFPDRDNKSAGMTVPCRKKFVW